MMQEGFLPYALSRKISVITFILVLFFLFDYSWIIALFILLLWLFNDIANAFIQLLFTKVSHLSEST